MPDNPTNIQEILPINTQANAHPFVTKQTFSFRKNGDGLRLHVCPRTFYESGISQLNSELNIITGDDSPIDNVIFENIPRIEVREYILESRLKAFMNAFGAFTRGFDAADEYSINWDAIKLNRGVLLNRINSIGDDVTKIIDEIVEAQKSSLNGFQGTFYTNKNKLGLSDTSYLSLPFYLYYCMLTATTTGLYTFPFDGKQVEESNGSEGWGSELGGSVNFGNSNIIQSVMSFLGGNIRWDVQPFWKQAKSVNFNSFELTINLFNDDINGAIANYLCVQNLIVKNKYIQYKIFQGSPAVYDIKIQGLNRFYMCSAKVSVNYKGVLRKIPDNYSREMDKYIKPEWKSIFLDNDAFGKIPDVYELKITFQPLLPNSLNNYLFKFLANNKMSIDDENKLDIGDTFENKVNENLFKELTSSGVITKKNASSQ